MNGLQISGRVARSRIVQIALATTAALFLRGVLDFTYINYVDKFFAATLGGDFFAITGIETLRLLESYAVTFCLIIWLADSLYRRQRPSGIALVLYFTVIILPISSLYGLTDVPSSFFYAASGSFAVLIAVTGLLPRVKVPTPGRYLVYLGITAMVGLCAYVFGWLVFTEGLERLNYDLLSVYEARSAYIQTLWPFMGYFIPWQANVIDIFAMFYALERRNYWLLALAGAAQLLLFGTTGHRSFLLAPILAAGVYFLWGKRNSLIYFFCASSVLVLGSYLLFLATSEHTIPSILIRRIFFVPATNHFIYYDFFSQSCNQFVMLSNSILATFVQYPYDMPVTRMISWSYWGKDFSPNVGYLGDAFAHFGFMGMFLFSIFLGIILRSVDSAGRRLPDNFVAAVIATPAMALTNSALFTSMLTHGLIPAIVLLWLLGIRRKNV